MTASSNFAILCKNIMDNISQKKFPNYGENSLSYAGIEKLIVVNEEIDIKSFLDAILNKEVDELEISKKLLKRLKGAGINFIKDIFDKDESELKK